MSLSPEQRAAAERSGQDACCVAGPGSGKTRVLIFRYEWLIRSGIDPGEILVITFTEKATRELKTRAAVTFREDRVRRRQVERAAIYTIDAFCHSLLRAHALDAGLDPLFRVLDEREARLESLAAMETVLDRFAGEHPTRFRTLLETWSEPIEKIASALLEVHSKIRTHGLPIAAALATPQRVPDIDTELDALIAGVQADLRACPPRKSPPQHRDFAALQEWISLRGAIPLPAWLDGFKVTKAAFKSAHPLGATIDRIRATVQATRHNIVTVERQPERQFLADILIAYDGEFRRRKRAIAGLDFADLNEFALSLLRQHPALLREVRERFRHILMDELQDTSPLQWQLVDLVRGERNFFAVGDINQSIFGFRRAEPKIFRDFRAAIEQRGEVDRLTRNYRSHPSLLEVVNRVVPALPGVEPHTLLPRENDPRQPEPCVELIRVDGDGNDEETEALWIAWRVRQLLDESQGGLSPSQVAVLARSTNSFDPLEAAFARFRIPCLVKRGRNFFEQPEVVDLTNWLRVFDNPQNEAALAGLLRSPFFGLTDEEIYRRRLDGTLLLDPIREARRLRAEIPVDLLLARVIDGSGFLQTLNADARANVDKFLDILRQLHAAHPEGLSVWIEKIDGLRADAKETNALVPGAGAAVEILTVHTAKGLEWPVVVVASIARHGRSSGSNVTWSPEHGIGGRWKSPVAATDRAFEAAEAETQERENAEEDRLLYVAMTRAERRLILVWRDVKSPFQWARAIKNALSPEFPEPAFQWRSHQLVNLLRVEGKPDLPASASSLFETAPNPEAIAPLPLAPQSPPSVSVTALAHFYDCPRRHLLANILHWPAPIVETVEAAEPASNAMVLGTEVHELLAGLRDTADASPLAQDLLANFHRSDLGRRAARARRAAREFDFLVETEGILLQGAIDLWFEDEQGIVLVDYKSDLHWSEAREEDYAAQLRLYALALARHTGRPVDEAWLFRLRDAAAIPVDLNPALAPALIRNYQAATRAGQYPTRPADRCTWCPYAGHPCPDAPRVRT